MARKTYKKSSSRKSTSKRKRSTSKTSKLNRQIRKISAERKLDILGVILLLLGIIFLLGFLGVGQTGLTGWIILLLGWIAGLGAILFPLMLIFVGLWFLVRNEQRFPCFPQNVCWAWCCFT